MHRVKQIKVATSTTSPARFVSPRPAAECQDPLECAWISLGSHMISGSAPTPSRDVSARTSGPAGAAEGATRHRILPLRQLGSPLAEAGPQQRDGGLVWVSTLVIQSVVRRLSLRY